MAEGGDEVIEFGIEIEYAAAYWGLIGLIVLLAIIYFLDQAHND